MQSRPQRSNSLYVSVKINFVTPEGARQFLERWHGAPIPEPVRRSRFRAPLRVTYAPIQGIEQNLVDFWHHTDKGEPTPTLFHLGADAEMLLQLAPGALLPSH